MTFTWNETPARAVPEVESSPVSVFVVSIRLELLDSAVTTARELVRELHPHIVVLAPQVVPYPLDLDHPPVAPSFLEKKLLSNNVDSAKILLCRDEADAVLGVLAPESIVVLGAKKRWWRTREMALAAKLRKAGHHVVMAYD